MKKVPKYVVHAMQQVVSHSHALNENMNKIEEWLYRNGIDPDELRKGDGIGLDELEYGQCRPDYIENLVYEIEKYTQNM